MNTLKLWLTFAAGIILGTTITMMASFYQINIMMEKVKSNKRHTPGIADSLDQQQCNECKKFNYADVELYREVRILCWVMTSPTTLYSKAIHVNATWAKHCNKVLFMSSIPDQDFPAIGLNVSEGRKHLYDKTKAAFTYIWKHHKNDADWFLKADDDTYVIIENLRYLLKDYDTSLPMYFGRKFKKFVRQGYMSGGAGYVLSKEALRRFDQALRTRRCRIIRTTDEDLEIGRCMEIVGVKAMDSRDEEKKKTFFPFSPEYHLMTNRIPKDNWLWKYSYYPETVGSQCCSDHTVSFHYITPDMMYILEYFIYHFRTFGIMKPDTSTQNCSNSHFENKP